MGSTNKYFQDLNGLGLDLWYEQKPYSGSTSSAKWTDASINIRNHSKDPDSTVPIYTTIFRGKDSTSEFVGSNLQNIKDVDVNQTSLTDIIEWSQGWKSTFLTHADFAYLKNLGVYPTNRLMIARRFSGPTQNNLLKIADSPMATMISWMPDDSDFFNITFGEEWEYAQRTSFSDILNSLGDDFGKKSKVGEAAASGFKSFSLPGWTESLQIELFNLLFPDLKGKYDSNNPPFGNPNLIKETKTRTLVSKDQSGSGLNSRFSIKFVVEYEQKFLNGVDPSLVYLDILHKALIFGTSKSVFFFGDVLESGSSEFIKNLISGDYNAVKKALSDFGEAISNSLKKIAKELEQKNKNRKINTADLTYDILNNLGKTVIASLVSKYRIKLFGVLQALTGAPSGYWHVTLGNPKKPFFSSGDLITTGVSMTFGKVLSFNDLPSSIKLEFTMEPARNLGGQEIMDRFNTGSGRTYYQSKRSYIEIQDGNNTNSRSRFKDNLNYNNQPTPPTNS